MNCIAFGNTGLMVTPVGFGAGHVGGAELTEGEAGRLLNLALDLGIRLIDTARGYGLSEARIGRHLAHRRDELVLSTKIGYGIPGFADWTPAIIEAGVTEALRLLRTDCLDVVHLHSCPRHTLEHSGVVEALQKEQRKGRVRVAAYSGENEELDWAVASGRFASVQCSVNICDQLSLDGALRQAGARGLGVIAKRPLANVPWRFQERPAGQYAEVYWDRLRQMDLQPGGIPWEEFALRFVLAQPQVHCAIVGTRKEAHLRDMVENARKGALPAPQVEALRKAFAGHGAGWRGEV